MTNNKRRCSGSSLPGENEQRRRQRGPPLTVVIHPKNTDDDNDTEYGTRTIRSKVRSWSSMSSCDSTASSLASTLTPLTAVEQDRLPIDLDTDADPEEDQQLRWRRRISRELARAASSGDTDTLVQILTDQRLAPFLNIDMPEDEQDGITPLIYGACFGKVEAVRVLLDHGAQVDVQDKRGWSALMWATTNNHSEVVDLLLDRGASFNTKSASGRTAFDFVDAENEQMVHTLSRRESLPCLARHLSRRESNTGTNRSSHLDVKTQHTSQETEDDSQSISSDTEESAEKEADTIASCEAILQSVHQFAWDLCLPDQMFVFSENHIQHILDTAITHITLPMKSRQEIWVSANIIFLCARFAHYYSSRDMLHTLLNTAIHKVTSVIKQKTSDIHTLAFWMSNLSQLLYYLKKDSGLVAATAEHQLEIAELISETYTLLIIDAEQRIGCILEAAVLEYEPIEELTGVDFADDWQRFFRRSRSRASLTPLSPSPLNDTSSVSPRMLSPQSVTQLLSMILYVLESYDVHPAIHQHVLAQLFHFISCEAFNRILANKKYLCRSKAMQIRMNISTLEEWVREKQLPDRVSHTLDPLIQLVQLLQCLSQMTELNVFIDATKSFDLLNALQLKRCIVNYRYEVSENQLPEEIVKYVLQNAKDTIPRRRPSSYCDPRHRGSREPSPNAKRPTSTSSLSNLFSRKPSQGTSHDHVDRDSDSDDDDDDGQYAWAVEKRDANYMLPFSVPNTSIRAWHTYQKPITTPVPADMQAMLSDSICHELRMKRCAERDRQAADRDLVPTIPEEWMERLDKITLVV